MGDVEEEWLWGWDATPGIVSVWAEPDGRAWVWRRVAASSCATTCGFGPGCSSPRSTICSTSEIG